MVLASDASLLLHLDRSQRGLKSAIIWFYRIPRLFKSQEFFYFKQHSLNSYWSCLRRNVQKQVEKYSPSPTGKKTLPQFCLMLAVKDHTELILFLFAKQRVNNDPKLKKETKTCCPLIFWSRRPKHCLPVCEIRGFYKSPGDDVPETTRLHIIYFYKIFECCSYFLLYFGSKFSSVMCSYWTKVI